MSVSYVKMSADELTAGDRVSAPGQWRSGIVVEVREATHALAAAHGAYAVAVEYERTIEADRVKFGTHYVHTYTAFPGFTFLRPVQS